VPVLPSKPLSIFWMIVPRNVLSVPLSLCIWFVVTIVTIFLWCCCLMVCCYDVDVVVAVRIHSRLHVSRPLPLGLWALVISFSPLRIIACYSSSLTSSLITSVASLTLLVLPLGSYHTSLLPIVRVLRYTVTPLRR